MKSYKVCIVAAGLLAGAAGASAQSPNYTITDLGVVGSPTTMAVVEPFVVTNRGLIAGGAVIGANEHAVLWYQGRTLDLGTLGLAGTNSLAFSGNDNGQVIGEAETWTSYPYHEDFCGFKALGLPSYGSACLPFVWQNGVMRPLPTLGGYNGVAIWTNAGGDVVGWAENTTTQPDCPAPQKFQFKPVLWQKGQIQELPTFAGDPLGTTDFIADNGIVVGSSGICGEFGTSFFAPYQGIHALMWQNGKLTDLGNLGGTGHGGGNTGIGVNNQGEVVGNSDLPGDQETHAFLWTKQKGMRDLGTLNGDVGSVGVSINDAGQIVGCSFDGDGNLRGAFWQNGVATDFNDLIPADSPLYVLSASSINSQGKSWDWRRMRPAISTGTSRHQRARTES